MLSPSCAVFPAPESSMLHMEPNMPHRSQPSTSASSRILDIPCKVCGDFSSGKHYNIFACDGCAGFFKRSIRRSRRYVCKAKDEGSCTIDKTHRNQCRACRLHKCMTVGMNKDAVQHERGPRNSTLRRQQMSHQAYFHEPRPMVSPQGNVLNLTVARFQPPTTAIEQPLSVVPAAPYPLIPRLLQIPIPSYTSPLLTHQAICESAAQLLFMNVQWVRSVPSFTALSSSDQLLLLEESWLDLFILGAGQFLGFIDFRLLVQTCGIFSRGVDAAETFLREVTIFHNALKDIQQFRLDQNEYASLRAIVLFKTSFDDAGNSASPRKEKQLKETDRVSALQEDAQMMLNNYVTSTYPNERLRFGKLLLLATSTFKNVKATTIEELFFKRVIENTHIVTIISNMYRAQILKEGRH